MIEYSKKNIIGLDLGDLCLKAMQFKKRGNKLFATSFVNESIPEGIIKDGEIKQHDQLCALLQNALDSPFGRKFNGNNVVCNLPEEKVFIRIIKLPPMEKQEIEKAIKWEIEAHIPLKINEVYIDWNIIKSEKDNINILIAAAPKVLVDSYLDLLQKCRLCPVALEPESIAVVRALLKPDSVSTIIVDIGSTGTNFIIFSGGAIRFTSHAAISDQIFIQALMKKMEVDQKQAIKLKIKTGLDIDRKKIYNAIEPIADKLVKKIQEYISFYHDHTSNVDEENKQIEKILLCGDGSFLRNLPEFINQKLNFSVSLANCSNNILFDDQLKKHQSKLLDCAVVSGLALRNI